MSQILQLPKNTRSVIFDCDGTILNSEPLHAKALQESFCAFGVDLPLMQFTQNFRGFHDHQVFNEVMQNQKVKIRRQDFLELKTEIIIKDLSNLSEIELTSLLTKGFLDCCKNLHAQNILISVVSSSEKEFLEALFKRLKIDNLLYVVIHADSIQNPKPNPAPYIKALELTGIQAKQTLALEDSEVGLRSALDAGIPTVWVNAHHKSPSCPLNVEILQCENFYWLNSDQFP